MADPKIYIDVQDFTVKKIFDKKYKAVAEKCMKSVAMDVINKDKAFTMKKSGDIGPIEYYLKGFVDELSMTGTGRAGEMEVKIGSEFGKGTREMISTLPKTKGSFKGLSAKPDKDIEYLIDAVWAPFVAKILKAIQTYNAKNA